MPDLGNPHSDLPHLVRVAPTLPRHATGEYDDCAPWCERCRRARELGIRMDADDATFAAALEPLR